MVNKHTVGTCSLCGVPVQIPEAWHGVAPPVPQCARCHAVASTDYGPVVPMKDPHSREEPDLQELADHVRRNRRAMVSEKT